ncbi:MAG: beta-N-acetylhexosaminidase [Flavobacterium sp.]|nr:beta-N-acetylhexosaminidase [Flavobacterium sp.]
MLRKVIFLLFLTASGFSQNLLPLIPQPQFVVIKKGNFILNNATLIRAEASPFEAKFLKEYLEKQYGLQLKSGTKPSVREIVLQIVAADATVSKEKYQLAITDRTVYITAADNQGIFYGIQTFLQLLPTEKGSVLKISCLEINDEPKFKWRGMHLDVARHFFSPAFVKKYIDYIAMYKMNTFHWHLTDDQGWRIEIKKYPKLTSISAFRKGSMVGHYNDQKYDDIRYGGFYTQEEIKEIVKYASDRHITIIPEIEMPGHAQAALAAYPELSCTGGPFEVAKQWGVLDDVFCPKDETFVFLENVLTEVIDLFPSAYIHIGGDECPKTRWKNCPHCQELMQRQGLKDEHELQSYFIRVIERFVNSKGRKIIGWDEILEGGLAPNAAVMSWRGTEGGIAAAKDQHFVVMSPGSHCYFDQYQADPATEPLAIGGNITVEKVYAYQPIPEGLSTEESKYIMGAQANVWTEYITTPKHVEYMIFPRMAALAEVVWGTSDTSKYADFKKRLLEHFALLDKLGVNYSKAILKP